MKTSTLLIFVGLAILGIGLYLEHPVKNWAMWRKFAMPSAIALVILMIYGLRNIGPSFVNQTYHGTTMLVANYFHILILIFTVMAGAAIVVRANMHSVTKTLKSPYAIPAVVGAAVSAPSASAWGPAMDDVWADPAQRWNVVLFASIIPYLSFGIFFFRGMGIKTESLRATMMQSSVLCALIVLMALYVLRPVLNKWLVSLH